VEFLIVVIVAFLVWQFIKGISEGNAKTAYQEALKELKSRPNDPDLREKVLQFGRVYAAKVRNEKGTSIFDEVALMNDINAACARATVGENSVAKVHVTNVAAMGGPTVAEQIEKLGKLFLEGVISAPEFERGKALFLGAAPDKGAAAIELLQNLHGLKQKGVLSESEFNSKKWDVLSERIFVGERASLATTRPPETNKKSA
jgi:hypothetical protein